MNFALMEGMAPSLLPSLQCILLWYIEHMAIDHAMHVFALFRHFFRTLRDFTGRDCIAITPVEIFNYRTALSADVGWHLGSLAAPIKRWSAFGYPGVDPEVTKVFAEMRIKGITKGEAVRTMCPHRGPLTDVEFEALIASLNNAFGEGSIERCDYLLCWLSLTLGARPIQMAALKVCDLTVAVLADGGKSYILRVPRAKQQYQEPRSSFTDRPINPDIGELLEKHVIDVGSRFANVIKAGQAPMFPARRIDGKGWATGFEWHCTAEGLGKWGSDTLETLGVISERTGSAMAVNMARLRRTVGTRAAMEGHGVLVIAELLDHTDTQNAGVYVEARPEIVERIDRALAMHLAPLAQAFAGVLVDSDQQEGNRRNPIIDPRFDEGRGPVGTCGMHGFCGLAAPVACYTCRNFNAWVDGPHEEVLQYLLAERETLMAAGSARIAAINDRTIYAVAEVVRLCDERRNADGEAADA